MPQKTVLSETNAASIPADQSFPQIFTAIESAGQEATDSKAEVAVEKQAVFACSGHAGHMQNTVAASFAEQTHRKPAATMIDQDDCSSCSVSSGVAYSGTCITVVHHFAAAVSFLAEKSKQAKKRCSSTTGRTDSKSLDR